MAIFLGQCHVYQYFRCHFAHLYRNKPHGHNLLQGSRDQCAMFDSDDFWKCRDNGKPDLGGRNHYGSGNSLFGNQQYNFDTFGLHRKHPMAVVHRQ